MPRSDGAASTSAAGGATGIRLRATATAMPAPVALASTFDPSLAYPYGATVGRDGRALGMDVLLSPMVNAIRVPTAGRNFETFSEDPLVSSATVAADVRGIASQGLIATVKHLAVNNQETNRRTDAITKGQDQEMPSGTDFGAALKTAIAQGTIPGRRVLRCQQGA